MKTVYAALVLLLLSMGLSAHREGETRLRRLPRRETSRRTAFSSQFQSLAFFEKLGQTRHRRRAFRQKRTAG